MSALELETAHLRFVARLLHFNIKENAAMQARQIANVNSWRRAAAFASTARTPKEADRIALRLQNENEARAYRLKLAEESLAYFLEQLGAKPCTCDTSYDERLGQTKPHVDSCFVRSI